MISDIISDRKGKKYTSNKINKNMFFIDYLIDRSIKISAICNQDDVLSSIIAISFDEKYDDIDY